MSEETTVESLKETSIEKHFSEVIQTNGQIDSKLYHYKITLPDQSFSIGVLAPNGTMAKEALIQQLPKEVIIDFQCVIDKVMQVH